MTQDKQSSGNPAQAPATLSVRVEHVRDAFGIGTDRPRLSWVVETRDSGWLQAAYEIEEYDSDGGLINQTGRVQSDQSVLLDWPFAPLQSRERVSLRSRVWGTDGSESSWSEPVQLEAGLFHAEDWSAAFISPTWDEDTTISNPSPYLRREFELRSAIKSARLYITSLGLYEAEINGKVVGGFHTRLDGL
jgi:alpha-L-rhamnosidase